jgi:hypothetical protein
VKVSGLPLPVWLFVSYGGGHLRALLPVARRVQELGIAAPVYLALTTAAPVAAKAGLRCLRFADLLRSSDEYAISMGEQLFGRLDVQAADRSESVAYLGLSYAELEVQLGKQAAADLYQRFGRQAFLPVETLKRAIRQCGASLVVTTNSPRAERAAVHAARALGVPSVCVVDLGGIEERDILADPAYADALCVLNDGVRSNLVSAGRPPATVWVTGNPAFDTVNDPAMKSAGAACRQQAGWERLHVCLFASSPEPQHSPGIAGTGDPAFPRKIEDALIDQVRSNPSLALWVRRHPSEPAAAAIARAAHPRVRVSDGDMPLHAAIHASDEVIVTVSTVGIEAALAGKPVTQVRGSILDALHAELFNVIGLKARQLTLAEIPAAYQIGAAGHHVQPAFATALQPSANATEHVLRVLQSTDAIHRNA